MKLLTLFVTSLFIIQLCLFNPNSAKRRPHIIFIMVDQMRQDGYGGYPGSASLTPNLNTLSQDGLLFTNSFTSTPSCTPARAAILTGRSPWGHGMLGYGKVSTNYSYELVHPLYEANYFTASIGKNHFGYYTPIEPVMHGYEYHTLYDGLGPGTPEASSCCFDDYDVWFQTQLPGSDPEITGGNSMNFNSWQGSPFAYDNFYHPTAWVTREAIDFLDSYNFTAAGINDRPLFLKISYHRPHSPYDPPFSAYNHTYFNADLNKITNIIHGNNWDNRFADDIEYCGPQFEDAWCGYMPPVMTNKSRIMYYANINFIDENIGTIIKKLRKLGVYEDSFILFTADHGDQLGDHNLWRKTYPYRSNARIPFVIKWPSSTNLTFNTKNVKIERGTINTDLVVELRDILPTFHQGVAGLTISEKLEGNDLTCILFNDDPYKQCGWREYLDLEHSTCYNKTNHWNALTDAKWKYIFNAYFATEQLFDLVNDPDEMNDLVPTATTNSSINSTLLLWRQRMVQQFQNEQRGDDWVKHGVLQQRVKPLVYGPNYPGYKPPFGEEIID